NSTIIPTVKLSSVESAYWCRMGGKEFLRWAQTVDDDTLLDGLARLHAKRQSAIGEARFIGAFRACGIVIPVWELPRGTEAADIEEAVAEYWPRFEAALASKEPLSSDERRARAGLVARQVTLRCPLPPAASRGPAETDCAGLRAVGRSTPGEPVSPGVA